MSVGDKLTKTKNFFQSVFLHDEYYIDAILASFASRSNLCLLGFRGSGKTHAMECLCKMVDKSCVAIQQGYLSAELEDVFARPDIPSLMKGEEKVVWKNMVTARIKAFDEIQRLGVGALSAMFRLMTSGTVMYFDQEAGVKQFWVIATANPTELTEDNLNVRLPEPLWDRFDAVCWVPIAPLKYQIRINGKVDKAKEDLPEIWKEDDLLALWKEVESIEIDERVEYVITLINRILGFCQKAQNYDASSLTEAQKRDLCSQCNTSYICSNIARPPSVRAKLALTRLAKGFAYLRGSNKVELVDIERAFPLVYWKRVVLMDEAQVANRLERLKQLARQLMTEIREVKMAVDLVEELKNKYDANKYRDLEHWVNAKGWLVEVKEDLDTYYECLRQQLRAKAKGANNETMYKIYMLAKQKLPPNMAREFEICESIEIELTNENLAKLVTIDASLFKQAKEAMQNGNNRLTLTGEHAFRWVLKK
jgi:MoxR-like ATPase